MFEIGDAEALAFPDDTFDCVYSIGVIHHSADDRAAIRSLRRVLRQGGTAHVFLYRKWSPKVSVAKSLRAVQSLVDRLTGVDRSIYRALYGRHTERFLGTMLLECFGVPHMRWYSRAEMMDLFKDFEIRTLRRSGSKR